ncbi:MAG: carbohydrate kinase family protein [Methanobacteriota archaeon]|nr:MAG: carbohydrate kinase family protein [Euryarchaeota archaeon]
MQAAPPVPTPDRRLSHRVRRRRPLRSVPRPRGGSRLRQGRARPVVRPGRDRVHLVRPFRGRATERGGPDVRNYLGAFGHVAIDHIVTLRRLPRPNTSIEILGRRRSFGGTAGNLSRAAACLGVKTSLASFVGEDFPSDYRKALRKDGVDLTDLRPIRGATTPTAWIFSDSAGNQMAIIDQGPMKEGVRLPILRHSVVDVELVHLGTGRPQYYIRIARLAAELDRTIAFDPSQEIHYVYTPRLFRTLLRHTAYFFGNEAEIIQAKRFLRVTSTEGLLRFAPVVIVTLGSRGSAVHTRDGKIRIPRVPSTRVADVTGAGDAYRAGFYAGLSRGFDLRHCGILGSSVASFVVEAQGTQTHLPTWTQAVQRARKYAPF